MTLLPPGLGGNDLIAWRLDQSSFAATWDSGEGAFRVGGRWNSPGTRAVYCSLDPSTAILEVAVHKGFRALDAVPHVLTAIEIVNREAIHLVMPDNLPETDWLTPGLPDVGQQRFGDALLREHALFAVPSAVSTQSWNLVFTPERAGNDYRLRQQEEFVLDPRLHAGR
jgi:RES domain-containing protein